MNGLSLVEDGLSGIHRQDEVLLVEQEPRAKLVAAHRVVDVRLYVMLALENRTENGDVADFNRYAIYERILARILNLAWGNREVL